MGRESDPPVGNFNARYGCFLAKPFHHFPSPVRPPQLRGASSDCADERLPPDNVSRSKAVARGAVRTMIGKRAAVAL